jgi:hypothetical protein
MTGNNNVISFSQAEITNPNVIALPQVETEVVADLIAA